MVGLDGWGVSFSSVMRLGMEKWWIRMEKSEFDFDSEISARLY